MSDTHSGLLTAAKVTLAEINKYPEELNRSLLAQVKAIADYAVKRINEAVSLDYTIKCSNCHLSLSEMINNTALVPHKLSELEVAGMSIVKEAPPALEPTLDPDELPSPTPVPKIPKRLSLKISHQTTVGEFKRLLQLQLQQVAGMQDSDEIEIDF